MDKYIPDKELLKKWRESILSKSFRGQNYSIDKELTGVPGDLIIFHPWLVHRGGRHTLEMDPKAHFFIQLQWVPDTQKYGTYTANLQYYMSFSFVGMSECLEVFFEEIPVFKELW